MRRLILFNDPIAPSRAAANECIGLLKYGFTLRVPVLDSLIGRECRADEPNMSGVCFLIVRPVSGLGLGESVCGLATSISGISLGLNRWGLEDHEAATEVCATLTGYTDSAKLQVGSWISLRRCDHPVPSVPAH
jgi:hypothetical protein